MSIFNCYKTQPDGYARFEMLGKPMEGEFYRYDSFDDIDPKVGYIRPFDKVIRQQLIDNLQAKQGIDLQRFIAKDDLIICDAYVTDKHIQSPYQIVIDRFDFIDKSELVTDQEAIRSCRVDLLQRQYILASNLKEPKETMDSINAEYLRWITPCYEPLRYERKWSTKHREGLLRFGALVVIAVLAYFYFR